MCVKKSDACILYLEKRRVTGYCFLASLHIQTRLFCSRFHSGGWFHCLGLGELFASLTQFIDNIDKSFRKFQQVAMHVSGFGSRTSEKQVETWLFAAWGLWCLVWPWPKLTEVVYSVYVICICLYPVCPYLKFCIHHTWLPCKWNGKSSS